MTLFSTDFYNFYFFVNINAGIPQFRIKTLNNVVAMVELGRREK